MKRLVPMLLFFLVTPLAWAQIHKWTDERGRLQYGEKPPPGVKSSPVKPAAPAASAAKPADPAAQEREFRQRQMQRRETEERQAADAKLSQARCESARNGLASSEQAGAIYRREKGEKVYFDDAQRRAHLEKLRGDVARLCR